MGARPKVGDVFAIPLPCGKYAYGRLYKDASVSIYDYQSEGIQGIEVIKDIPILFFSGVFDTALINGDWPRIGHIPFQSEKESWPPPTYIQDIVNPSMFRIYYMGEMKAVHRAEIDGLEKQGIRKPEQLVEEIEFRLSNKKC